MGNTLILHIGYPKTATTWFQKLFFPYVKNYFYKKNSHQILIGQEKITNFQQNIILSSESLVNLIGPKLNPQNFFSKYSYIINNYKHIKILVFIRNQKDLLGSAYSYLSQGGKYKNFSDFFSHIKKLRYKQWQYYTHLQFFENFPNSKMYIYLFEDFINNPLQTIEKLTKDLELDIDLNKINFKKKKQSPPSYLLPLISTSGKINTFLGKVMLKLSHNIPGKRFNIPEKYIPEIKNKTVAIFTNYEFLVFSGFFRKISVKNSMKIQY